MLFRSDSYSGLSRGLQRGGAWRLEARGVAAARQASRDQRPVRPRLGPESLKKTAQWLKQQQGLRVWSVMLATQSCLTLCNPVDCMQPTRLLCPWDSPGQNTGVGCHFFLQCMKVKSESEVAQSCPTLSDPMDCMQPTRLLCPWDFPGKSTGVGCHCLLWNSSISILKIGLVVLNVSTKI